MPLEFPPVVLDPTDQIISFAGIVSNIFLVLWCVNIWKDSKELTRTKPEVFSGMCSNGKI